MQLSEPFAVSDIYASGLGRVEVLKGGDVRFVLYVEKTRADGSVENEVVACVVIPLAAVPDAIAMTLAGTTISVANVIKKLMPAGAYH